MFKKKKVEKTPLNWPDKRMTELWNEFSEVTFRLEKKAVDAYVAAQVIPIYGNSPDADEAKRELEAKQHSLICSIGEYDDLRARIKEHVKAHSQEFLISWSTDFRTSHEVIFNEISRRVLTK